MKKLLFIIIPILAIALSGCESNTYEDIQDNTPVNGPLTYQQHIKPIISANCIACHREGGSASFRPLGSYAELKDAIQNTDLLERIQKQNGEQGLMPQTGRMPQASIDRILEWNIQGLLEN